MSKLDRTPDHPVSFGRKCSWLAIKSDDPRKVERELVLSHITSGGLSANWRTGIQAAHEGKCFISPPINGWILVVSTKLRYVGDSKHPDLCTPFLLQLAQHFSDVQFFATHRITDYHAWARLIEGQIIRQFAWVDMQKQWDIGAETPEEIALNLHFDDTFRDMEDENEDSEFLIPDEEDILQLAGAWSINPSILSTLNLPESTGYVCRMTPIDSEGKVIIESPWDVRAWLDERTDIHAWGPRLLNMAYTDEQRQQIFATYLDLARELKSMPEITQGLIWGRAGGHWSQIIGNVIAILQRNAALDVELAQQIIRGTWVAPQLSAGFALITQGEGIFKLEQFLLRAYQDIQPEVEPIYVKPWLTAYAALNLLDSTIAREFGKSSAFNQLTESDRDNCIRRTERYYNIWKDVSPV